VELDGVKKRLKILRTKVVSKQGSPGQFEPAQMIVYCGKDAIILEEVQPEGKKVMPAAAWRLGLKSAVTFLF
jgi:methionyl-tRNA formyltransferase